MARQITGLVFPAFGKVNQAKIAAEYEYLISAQIFFGRHDCRIFAKESHLEKNFAN